MQEIRLKIYRGARWLDEFLPDWQERIDLTRFDANQERQCIAGQLFGSYQKVFFRHLVPADNDEARHDWCQVHGFDLPRHSYSGDERERAWHTYTHAWMDHVLCRRRFVYHIYPHTWEGKEVRRMSFRKREDKDGWIDLGVVLDDTEIASRMAHPKDFVTSQVWDRLFG
jgi:hypothetical protein